MDRLSADYVVEYVVGSTADRVSVVSVSYVCFIKW
jgi:hypothetical protein